MSDINISNSKGRDAVVGMHSVSSAELIRWVDDSGRQANSSRFVKATLDHNLDALLTEHGDIESVGLALLEGDPEIDMENTGRRLQETARVFVDRHGGIVRNVRFWEVIKNPDGTERERRPRELTEQNVACDTPLSWSGIFIPKATAVRKFVFSGKAQLQHINGLTYDFLFAMAQNLEERNSLMMLGAGPKSNQPLILRRGSTPYRGFLEGRTDGDKYCLLLHLSNLELKAVPAADVESESKPKPSDNSTSKKTSEESADASAAKSSTQKTEEETKADDSKAAQPLATQPTEKGTRKAAKKTSAKKSAKKKTTKKKVTAGSDSSKEKPTPKKAVKKKSPKKKAAPRKTAKKEGGCEKGRRKISPKI